MSKKIQIGVPVVVEGKYDKIRLSNIIEANIITTDGFGIFNNKEKQLLLRKLSENGIIILTDSDSAGGFIRSTLTGYISKDKIFNLYSPIVKGVEKRKLHASKDGLLGVEGIDDDSIRLIFQNFVDSHGEFGKIDVGNPVTKNDFYEAGLTGRENSVQLRNEYCKKIGLPSNMTANALLAAVNTLYNREKFLKTLTGSL